MTQPAAEKFHSPERRRHFLLKRLHAVIEFAPGMSTAHKHRLELNAECWGTSVLDKNNSATVEGSGLTARAIVAVPRHWGRSEHVRHRFGANIGVAEMLLFAKEFGLKARTYQSRWKRLATRRCLA